MTYRTSELILHVGLPKTGTTAIQRFMFRHRKEYEEQGVYWAETFPTGEKAINDWTHHVYSHKWGGWIEPEHFSVTPDEAWLALAEAMRAKPGRYILSSERFADLLPLPVCGDVLTFIQRCVQPADLTLIGYVRRQDSLVESHVKELIKGGDLQVSLEDYLANLMHHASFVFFDSGFLKAREVLGSSNVIARVYDRQTLFRGDVVADFLKTCRLPMLEGRQQERTNPNPSLNTLCGKVFSDERTMAALSGNPELRSEMISFLSQARFDEINAYSFLSEQQRDRLMTDFEAGNAEFARQFLSKAEYAALARESSLSKPSLSCDAKVLTTEDLVQLLLAFA